ncbi:hypothetical protein V8C34DRAFT_283372 [Trichoderma compactum]
MFHLRQTARTAGPHSRFAPLARQSLSHNREREKKKRRDETLGLIQLGRIRQLRLCIGPRQRLEEEKEKITSRAASNPISAFVSNP